MKDKGTTLKLLFWIWFKEMLKWHKHEIYPKLTIICFCCLFLSWYLYTGVYDYGIKLTYFYWPNWKLFCLPIDIKWYPSTVQLPEKIVYIYIWLNTDKIPCYSWRHTESSKTYMYLKLKFIAILNRIK